MKLLEIITSETVEKIVLMDPFFKSYPAKLNNQNKTKVKRYFIELVQYLEKQGVIQSKDAIIFVAPIEDYL
jgi:predicted transcriptional regulator YheO